MTQTEELKSLLDRLECAKGADRQLDEALMALLYVRGRKHIGTQEDSGPGGRWVPVENDVWIDPATDKWVSTAALDFTSSVDAAVRFVERAISQAEWEVKSKTPARDFCIAFVRLNDLTRVAGECETPALSLIAATLGVMIRRDGGS